MTAMFQLTYSLLLRLRNPFSCTVDRIDVDSLLANTDPTIFAFCLLAMSLPRQATKGRVRQGQCTRQERRERSFQE